MQHFISRLEKGEIPTNKRKKKGQEIIAISNVKEKPEHDEPDIAGD